MLAFWASRPDDNITILARWLAERLEFHAAAIRERPKSLPQTRANALQRVSASASKPKSISSTRGILPVAKVMNAIKARAEIFDFMPEARRTEEVRARLKLCGGLDTSCQLL